MRTLVIGKFIEAEHLRGPERIRECGNVPGGTPTLADMFRRYGGPEGPFPSGNERQHTRSAAIGGCWRDSSAFSGEERH